MKNIPSLVQRKPIPGHKISNESPVGAALLDCRQGDKVKVRIPSGVVEYEVIKME